MNSFGRIFRVTIFGESHGPLVGVTLDGVPAGIPLKPEDLSTDLERRKGAGQKGTTPRKESDIPLIQTGWFQDHTTGAPLTILFENKNVRPQDYETTRAIPRPGHADFVAHVKYAGYEDYRGGGHFSARLTTGIVAAGVLAGKIIQKALPEHRPKITAQVVEVGGIPEVEKGLQRAIDMKDSVGGVVACRITDLPIGLGAPFWDSLESLIAHAVFAIPAVKGIEFGSGFAAAAMSGSQHNDALISSAGTTATNHAGGIVGGLSNGNEIYFRVAFKPTASTPQSQTSWSRETNRPEAFSIKGRHDLCVALRAPVIVEAMAAIVLADLLLIDKKNY